MALDLPFVYVRPEPKKHGRQNQIEGLLSAGQQVIVIEDLISTGMSSLNAVKALRDFGAEVLGMVAIFSYNFQVANANFASEKTLPSYPQRLRPSAGQSFRNRHTSASMSSILLKNGAKVLTLGRINKLKN